MKTCESASFCAKVAELADAPDLGSGSRKAMGVRVPPFALLRSPASSASFGVQASEREDVSTEARSANVDSSASPQHMKTEFVDVNETRKNVRVEIPSDVVDAEIERVARDYSRKARVPGFRPGKAPARVIKQRFKEQILHDVAHDLIPRAVDDALRERGVEPVDTPDIRDVTIEEGQPLTFTASFDTVPRSSRATTATIALRRPSSRGRRRGGRRGAQRLRERAARFEPVEGRGVEHGDTALVDLERQATAGRASAGQPASRTSASSSARRPTRRDSTSSCSASKPARPRRSRSTTRPTTPIAELAGTDVTYTVTVKGIKRGVLPELDDEFAKDLGEFETLDALRARVREDLEHEARHAAEREVRARADEAARRARAVRGAGLARRARDRSPHRGVRAAADGAAGRPARRRASTGTRSARASARSAREAVGGALVLDEVARREQLDGRPTRRSSARSRATRSGRAGRRRPCARALEKEGGLSRVAAGLRREKAIDFLMARATISGDS